MTATKAAWSVVVIYDSPETREAAVSFCDQLVQRFWNNFEFDVSWWPVGKLLEEVSAHQAWRRAKEADLVVFALPPEGDLPLEVQAWVETWASERGDREGAIVGLIAGDHHFRTEAAEAEKRLRRVAHRAGMDYLTQLPQSFSWLFPESPEYCSERARQVTSVLDEILRQHPAPPRSML